ncbi:histidinol dehydrogenase [Candidatus Daviesbacteria bacterium]|nr:histidinol dehydrogenase [Candidatus Daviesbacteria bacterium]
MKIRKLSEINKNELERIKKRSADNYGSVLPVVKNIMEDVKKFGDKAILNYERKFGNPNLKTLRVTQKEINEAFQNAEKDLIKSLKQAIKNITKVATEQIKSYKEKPIQTEKGIKVWREFRPIEKVGLYIPGGKAVYPSSLLMSAIPAKIAGCKEIIVVSPPNPDGNIPAPVLAAAKLLDIKSIYKTGGAQAIAALAFGTNSIPKVYKIFGAGNLYVTAAKMLVYGEVDIDMPAGPSEVFIIADESANPKFIAADLLADGEHGEDSACILLTTSRKVAKQTLVEIKKQLRNLSTASRAKASLDKYGLIALVDNLNEAVEFVNDYAPEHLEIMTKNAKELVEKINNAGSVFLGNWTSKSSGDYATGANHILPTGGMAKMFNPLSVQSFIKMMEVQRVTKNGLLKIKNTVETLAEVEGLPAHGYSMKVRFKR